MLKSRCLELDRFRDEAVFALREAQRIRRSRDLSFQEDAELSRESYRRVSVLLKHLLTGHDEKPCPSGDRPIISLRSSE